MVLSTTATDSAHCCWGYTEGLGFVNACEMWKGEEAKPSKSDTVDKWNQRICAAFLSEQSPLNTEHLQKTKGLHCVISRVM